ncbi:Peptidyl-prolyl cis-trans isomerase cyp6 [Coelomomyces lativittatus]|nr:Peptidyl-prolyl cis-trans isomerase cyp6 [Coelomomyces lativittatus]
MFYMTNDIHSSLHQRGMVIGEVAEGMDVLEKINQAYVDTEGTPYQDIRIHHTVILDDPFPDPEGMKVPDTSPKRADLPLNVVRLDEYETFEDKDEITLAKEIREKEARSNAVALEIIGDLPFADIKPPENVLFVCRLNPVTQDEDLAQIFGRFGTLRSCEVVKDSLTQASLCYAFIEFEDKQACEMAYFKMDNVLIDDRRIKVDFSQSVSKLHHEWILARKKQGMGSGYGGFAHLTKKTQYREETWKSLDSKPSESSYALIFEHDADLKSGKKFPS